MLKNDYLVSKIGADTAENEPVEGSKGLRAVEEPRGDRREHLEPAPDEAQAHVQERVHLRALRVHILFVHREHWILATTHHSFQGSFSAVSTPMLATK